MDSKNDTQLTFPEVAGQFIDILRKYLSKDGRTWFEAVGRTLVKKKAWPEPGDFKIWKTLEFRPKSLGALRRGIESQGIRIGDLANKLLEKIKFPRKMFRFDLVILTVKELTGKDSATWLEILAGAVKLGLMKVPEWLGPFLRELYTDQPHGEFLWMGMDLVEDSDGVRRAFYLYRDDSGLWLDARGVHPGRLFGGGGRFVFVSRKSS